MNPDPEVWTDEDLAIRLSRTYRWSGESCWPNPLSVAQHSLLVLAIAQQLAGRPFSEARAQRELLHDAEEAFLGFDCISPLKRSLGEPFQWVSQRLLRAVWRRYRLPDWTATEQLAHKQADQMAAAAEAVHCVGWPLEEVRSVLGIEHEILEVDPLAKRYDTQPWMPWTAEQAAECFLAELRELEVKRSRAE
jgi:5'-deoxynucleotidase YfbR-like HD superfamily hydrolase